MGHAGLCHVTAGRAALRLFGTLGWGVGCPTSWRVLCRGARAAAQPGQWMDHAARLARLPMFAPWPGWSCCWASKAASTALAHCSRCLSVWRPSVVADARVRAASSRHALHCRYNRGAHQAPSAPTRARRPAHRIGEPGTGNPGVGLSAHRVGARRRATRRQRTSTAACAHLPLQQGHHPGRHRSARGLRCQTSGAPRSTGHGVTRPSRPPSMHWPHGVRVCLQAPCKAPVVVDRSAAKARYRTRSPRFARTPIGIMRRGHCRHIHFRRFHFPPWIPPPAPYRAYRPAGLACRRRTGGGVVHGVSLWVLPSTFCNRP